MDCRCAANWYGADCSVFGWPCDHCGGHGRCPDGLLECLCAPNWLVHPEAYTLHFQPSPLNTQPSTLNPQPSTLTPHPSPLNPSTLTPHPSILKQGTLCDQCSPGYYGADCLTFCDALLT